LELGLRLPVAASSIADAEIEQTGAGVLAEHLCLRVTQSGKCDEIMDGPTLGPNA